MRTSKRRVLPRMRDRVLVGSALVSGAWVTACQLVAGYGDPLDDGRPPANATDGATDSAATDGSSVGDENTLSAPVDGGADVSSDECIGGKNLQTSTPYPIDNFPDLDAQTVDGIPDEFCAAPHFDLTVAHGYAPSGDDAGVDAVVTVRLLWNAAALLLHAHVQESVVRPPLSIPHYGDALEVMFSTQATGLSGTYPLSTDGGSGDPAVRVILAAPGAGTTVETGGSALNVGGYFFPQHIQSFVRSVDGGFDIELQAPWGTPATLDAGTTILVDWTYDRGDADGGGRQFQSSFFVGHDAGLLPGCNGVFQAACDDRTWQSFSLDSIAVPLP